MTYEQIKTLAEALLKLVDKTASQPNENVIAQFIMAMDQAGAGIRPPYAAVHAVIHGSLAISRITNEKNLEQKFLAWCEASVLIALGSVSTMRMLKLDNDLSNRLVVELLVYCLCAIKITLKDLWHRYAGFRDVLAANADYANLVNVLNRIFQLLQIDDEEEKGDVHDGKENS